MAINDQLERIITALDYLNKTKTTGYPLSIEDRVYTISNQLQQLVDSGFGELPIHVCTAEEYDPETGIPTVENPEENTFYLVPNVDPEDPNMFMEYIYTGDHWELFGSGGQGVAGVGIASVAKTGTTGKIDTYTITYTDGTTSTFNVANGADGANVTIEETLVSGEDYTIDFEGTGVSPVESVAGKTGVVVLDGGDVGYNSAATYANGTIGKAVQGLDENLFDLQQDVDELGGNNIPLDSTDVQSETIKAAVSSLKSDFEDITYVQVGKNKYNSAACNPSNEAVYNSSGVYTTGMPKLATTGKIPVLASTRYVFSAGNVRIVSVRYFSGESGGTFISGENLDIGNATFVTPQNCTYAALNLFYADHTTEEYNAAISVSQLELGSIATAFEPYTETTVVKKTNIEDGALIDAVAEITEEQSQINLYDKSLAVDGKYVNSLHGEVQTAADYAYTGAIPVSPNTQYCLSVSIDAPMTLSTIVYEYGNDGSYLRSITAPSKYKVVVFVTDNDAYYIKVNMVLSDHTTQDFNDTIDTLMLCYGVNRPVNYTAYQKQAVVPNDKLGNAFFSTFNSFTGLKWVAFGTSITWYDGQKYTAGVHTDELCHGYVGDIAALKKFHSSNLAISGSTLGDYDSNSLVNRITNIDWTAMDICTIEYGVNDLGLNIPVGSVGDSPGTTTFAACLKKIIEYALTQNPMLIMVICTEPDVTGTSVNSNGNTLKDYTDVTLDVARLYRLPVCDWYYHSGINEMTKGGREYDYLTIDGKHPSDAGHRRMAAMLNQVFESLIC